MADDRRQAVIGPTEFAVLGKIYNSVLAEPWFTTDREQRDRFRRYIIKAFQAGVAETDQLAAHEVARHHFSSDPASSVPG